MPMPFRSRLTRLLFEGLWLDGLRLFVLYWKNWLIGFLLLVGCQVGLDWYVGHYTKDMLASAAQLGLDSFALYFFCACFLNQEPVTGTFSPNWRSFARSMLYMLAVDAILVISVLLVGLIVDSAEFLEVPWIGKDSNMAVRICGLLVFVTIAARLVCTVPLAINEVDRPLRRSLVITHGQVLRILANMAILIVIALPFGFVFQRVPIAGMALLSISMQGLVAGFACAASRVLNGDYIAANLTVDRRTSTRETP